MKIALVDDEQKCLDEMAGLISGFCTQRCCKRISESNVIDVTKKERYGRKNEKNIDDSPDFYIDSFNQSFRLLKSNKCN